MDGQPLPPPAPRLSEAALGALMPMFLWVSDGGEILAVGPTLARICAETRFLGRALFSVFHLQKPRVADDMAALAEAAGQRLQLVLAAPPRTGFRAIAVPLGAGQGMILNLSFGIAAAEAVRRHGLTHADFAPTDLTVELLYLTEVKAAVMGELAGLNRRLQTARATSEAAAMTDALTGLANRRALESDLLRECKITARGGGGFALLHLDLDYFKAVNDTYGHAAGDHVLCAAAEVLRHEMRATDTAARVGGDEFVLILRGDPTAEQAARAGTRIIAALERPIAFEGATCKISGSIGVTLSGSGQGADPDRLHAAADEALYAAKRAGRGRCVVAKG